MGPDRGIRGPASKRILKGDRIQYQNRGGGGGFKELLASKKTRKREKTIRTAYQQEGHTQ